jgi:hypothetical protein
MAYERILSHCIASSALLLFLAAGFGCATRSGQPSGKEKPNPYQGIIAQKCAACHDLALVREAHETKTNAEMREILRSHKDKPGSEITEQDLQRLLELYGPARGGA